MSPISTFMGHSDSIAESPLREASLPARNHGTRLRVGGAVALAVLAPQIPMHALGEEVNLSWTHTGNVSGFVLYAGGEPGNYQQEINIPNGSVRSIRLLNIGPTNFFAIAAYDAALVLSDLSNELRYSPASQQQVPQRTQSASAITIDFGVTPKPVTLSLTISEFGVPHIRACGSPGQHFQLQSSDNLKDWQLVGGGHISLAKVWNGVDTRPSANAKTGAKGAVYYRARMSPPVHEARTVDLFSSNHPQRLSLTISSSGVPIVETAGDPGSRFCIETSGDLKNWTFMTSGENDERGHWQCHDTLAAGDFVSPAGQAKFYRAVTISKYCK